MREMRGIELKIESERSFWLFTIGAFALLVGVNYFPVLFGKIPFPRDMVLQFQAWNGFPRSEAWQSYADIGDLVTSFYPFRAIASRSIREGTLPLWNPYFLSGTPFLASAQSSLFYPPNVLYYILPLPIAWTVCILVKMFLSALFMTLFVRSIGGSRAGAIFSGIIFASCGFMTAWQGQPMSDAAIWLPLICYTIQRLHQDHSRSSIAFVAFAFAMPVLAGHPETAAHVTLTGTAMALAIWGSSAKIRSRYFEMHFLLTFALAGLLAFGLAAIQTIPTLEWIGQLGDTLNVRWPALPHHQALGLVSRDILRGPNSAGIWVPESTAYVGIFSLLAVTLAPFHKVSRHVIFLTVMSILAFGIAYGVEPLHWLVGHVPILSGLKNERMILIASFGLAALAGMGVSALEDPSVFSHRRRTLALCFLAVAVAVTFLLIYNLQLRTAFKVEFSRRPSFSRALLFLSLIPIIWRLYGGLKGRWFPVIACALAAFDLVTFSYGYTGFAQMNEIFPRSPVFDFLAKNNDPARFRIVQVGIPYSPNAHLMYGASSADGYEVRIIPAQRRFTRDFTEDRMDSNFFTPAGVLALRDRRIDLLNVKYLVLEALASEFKQFETSARFRPVFNNGHVAVFENKSVLPRAFAVPASGIQVLPDVEKQLERLRDVSFNPERSAIASELPPSFRSPHDPVPSSFQSQVEMTGSHVNELSFHSQTSGPAVLVLSQTYYPGWKATVDEAEVPIFPVNIALTGIALPAGVHNVRFVFQPLSFRIGAALTLISLVITGGLMVAGLRAERQHASAPQS